MGKQNDGQEKNIQYMRDKDTDNAAKQILTMLLYRY
jgi:hypothetical protein